MYGRDERDAIERAVPRHQWLSIRAKARKLGLTRPGSDNQPSDPVIVALVEKRTRLKLSQGSAAQAIGINRASLNRFERGHKLPSMRDLRSWCAALRMNIAVFDIEPPSQ